MNILKISHEEIRADWRRQTPLMRFAVVCTIITLFDLPFVIMGVRALIFGMSITATATLVSLAVDHVFDKTVDKNK